MLTRDGVPVYASQELDYVIARLTILLVKAYNDLGETKLVRVNPESLFPIHKIIHPDLTEEWLVQEIECD